MNVPGPFGESHRAARYLTEFCLDGCATYTINGLLYRDCSFRTMVSCCNQIFSNGWLEKLRRLWRIKNFKSHGASSDADEYAIQECLPDLQRLASQYSPEDVWNADESGLFYKMVDGTWANNLNSPSTGAKETNGSNNLSCVLQFHEIREIWSYVDREVEVSSLCQEVSRGAWPRLQQQSEGLYDIRFIYRLAEALWSVHRQNMCTRSTALYRKLQCAWQTEDYARLLKHYSAISTTKHESDMLREVVFTVQTKYGEDN